MKQRDPKFTALAIVLILAVIYLLIVTKQSKPVVNESSSTNEQSFSYDTK